MEVNQTKSMKYLNLAILTILIVLFLPLQVNAGIPDAWGWATNAQTGSSECAFTSNSATVNALGCRCGHTYTETTGTDSIPYKVKCSRNRFVCSSNSYNPHDFTVCLYKIGQMPDLGNGEVGKATACEGGAVYDRISKTCELDTGGDPGQNDRTTGDIRNTIRRFINVALGFLGIVTVVMIIYGGFNWLTAAGSDEKIDKGKKIILWAAIGAIVISIAWTISSYVLQLGKSIG